MRKITDVKSGSELLREQGHKLVGKNNIAIGKMYMFFYDPKWKKELPYYDLFPCIFPFHLAKDRFLGINLHYLNYRFRAVLLDELFKYENNAKIDENKRIRINYGILKTFSKHNLVKPTIKWYLNNHVRSRFIRIPHEEWGMAAMLPVHDFQKAPDTKVWADSRRISGYKR